VNRSDYWLLNWKLLALIAAALTLLNLATGVPYPNSTPPAASDRR